MEVQEINAPNNVKLLIRDILYGSGMRQVPTRRPHYVAITGS